MFTSYIWRVHYIICAFGLLTVTGQRLQCVVGHSATARTRATNKTIRQSRTEQFFPLWIRDTTTRFFWRRCPRFLHRNVTWSVSHARFVRAHGKRYVFQSTGLSHSHTSYSRFGLLTRSVVGMCVAHAGGRYSKNVWYTRSIWCPVC